MSRVFIDVREPEEYSKGHAKGAINIPPAELLAGTDKLNNVTRDTELIVYCLSGSRSNAAIPYFAAMGFTNITNGINQQRVEQQYNV